MFPLVGRPPINPTGPLGDALRGRWPLLLVALRRQVAGHRAVGPEREPLLLS